MLEQEKRKMSYNPYGSLVFISPTKTIIELKKKGGQNREENELRIAEIATHTHTHQKNKKKKLQ